jgi:hypothetical protein
MNRRGFLGTLLGATAVMALDPEKLLWVPGQKKIFVPKPKMITVTFCIDKQYIIEFIQENSVYIASAVSKRANIDRDILNLRTSTPLQVGDVVTVSGGWAPYGS